MRFRRLFALAIAPALTFLAPAIAPAGPILDINTDAKGGVGQLATVTFNFNGNTETGLAGTLVTTLPGGQKIDTYCVDLYDTTYVGNGGSNWSAEVLPISAFKDYASGAHWGGIGYLYANYDATVAGRIDGAALQIAIWKVEYDGTNNLAAGTFQLSDSADAHSDQHLVYDRVNEYLASYDASKVDSGETFLRATSHPDHLYQDLVGPGTNAVPEPASIAMLGCGLATFLAARAWRGRRA